MFKRANIPFIRTRAWKGAELDLGAKIISNVRKDATSRDAKTTR